MKLKRALSLFMTAVLLSSSMPLNTFAEDISVDERAIVAEDNTVSGSALSVISPEIDVDFNITGQWDGGFNGEITIKGEDVEMNVKSLLTWSTYARNRYDEYILKLRQYAEDTIKIGDNLTIGSKGKDIDNDGIPDLGLIAYAKPNLTENNSDVCDVLYYSKGVTDAILDINWFSGYGECNAYLVGNFSRTSEEWYEGISKYVVFDMYDWDGGSKATLWEGVIPSDGELHKLHEAGLAREFYQSGTYTDTLDWYRQSPIY